MNKFTLLIFIIPMALINCSADNLYGHIDIDGGVAIDNNTGLIWTRCYLGDKWMNGNCIQEHDSQDYITTLNFIDRLNRKNFGGYSDWRLPTIIELKTLVRCHKGKDTIRSEDGSKQCTRDEKKKALSPKMFPRLHLSKYLSFWSSNFMQEEPNRAWALGAWTGGAHSMNKRNGIKAVAVRSQFESSNGKQVKSPVKTNSINMSGQYTIEYTSNDGKMKKIKCANYNEYWATRLDSGAWSVKDSWDKHLHNVATKACR
jgi:hypothetical protein